MQSKILRKFPICKTNLFEEIELNTKSFFVNCRASYSCSSFCMNHSTCGGFTVQSTIGCLYLEDTDVGKLVKSSKSGTKSREVWVKESKLNGNGDDTTLLLTVNPSFS